jgi:SAM-dependent methyltransferase
MVGRVSTPVDFDTELAGFGPLLRQAWALEPGDRVLDVGCGAGRTTREAAGLAASALGVDLSAAAVARARALSEGLANVRFDCADVQTYGFEPGSFDVVISRFGTMFYPDPVAAFGNIGRALRPSGRLVMLVWQARDRNEWAVAIREALGESGGDEGPNAFSLADPPAVREILGAAGFDDVHFTDVAVPVHYGSDVDSALAWVRGFACTSERLKGLDPDAALARLRDMLATHVTDDGVRLGSRAWIITARRAP